MKPRWRVLIADDHAPSKAAVAEAVAAMGGVVVGEGSTAAEVPALVDRCRPDVVVMTVGLPDGDGVKAARAVMERSPCPIVLLTSRTDPDVVARAGAVGVMAFLLKPLRREELRPTLDLAVARGRASTTPAEDLARAVEGARSLLRDGGPAGEIFHEHS